VLYLEFSAIIVRIISQVADEHTIHFSKVRSHSGIRP
jgi:hypothetical protein